MAETHGPSGFVVTPDDDIDVDFKGGDYVFDDIKPLEGTSHRVGERVRVRRCAKYDEFGDRVKPGESGSEEIKWHAGTVTQGLMLRHGQKCPTIKIRDRCEKVLP